MKPFLYQSQASRVVFGAGSLAQLAAEVAQLGARHVLVLCTPPQRALAERAASLLGERAAGIFDQAVMHVPVDSANAARAAASALGADAFVAIGGGSTIGLGKAIALTSSLPILAVPTTYAGSEMTPIYGITEHGVKTTGRDLRVLPRTVIYDPQLLGSLPARMACTSGVNAIAHAAEALYAKDANPVVSLMAEQSIRALGRSLPRLAHNAAEGDAIADALYGAWLAGICLGSVGMALHHKLCHALGGAFNLPHAEMHTILLPHTLAYNRHGAPEAMRKIAAALDAPDAALGVYDLIARLDVPMALSEIGMPADGLEHAASLAIKNPYDNPCPVSYGAVLQLLKDAHAGRRPGHAAITETTPCK
jgi:maleylacetate reductase